MIKPLLFAAAAFALATPTVASPLGGALSASQNATNNQSNSGTVIQNPSGGSQTNINQNNAFSSTYSFGPGISCPTSSIALGTYGAGGNGWGGGYNSGSGSYGATASVIIPLGGDVGSACRKLVQEIAHQRVLDTQVNMINVCSEFARQGVLIDTTKFPEFEVCSAVTVAGNHAVNVQPERVFSPPETAVPVVPIRKN